METITSTSQLKHAGGRPRQAATYIGQVYGHLTVLARVESPFTTDIHAYVACSCSCGRRTVAFPHIVRLDSLQSGRQVSCGCHGKRQFLLNWESFAAKLDGPICKAIFSAFARRPSAVVAIAKKFGVAAAMVGGAYRHHMKKLGAMTQVAKAWTLNISGLEQRCLDLKGHLYGAWSSPCGIELNEDDITDHMREMFCLSPAFDAI